MRHNANIDKIPDEYPFTLLAKKLKEYEDRTGIKPIRLHIGDVLGPITASPVDQMRLTMEQQMDPEKFLGYRDWEGVKETREAVAAYISQLSGSEIYPHEVFITYGIKDELPVLMWLFDRESKFAIERPVYPAFEGVILICASDDITYLVSDEQHGFKPPNPDRRVDCMIINRPNNPTGVGLTIAERQEKVDWARENKAVIVSDGAYFAFGSSPETAGSFYAADGSKSCVIEAYSFSKSHAATAMRCGALVVPEEIQCESTSRFYDKWNKMGGFMKNGVGLENQAFIRGALSESGLEESRLDLARYKAAKEVLVPGLTSLGFEVKGGEDAPYSMIKAPNGMSGHQLSDAFIAEGVAITPLEFFNLPGWGRVHHFITVPDAEEALRRIARVKL